MLSALMGYRARKLRSSIADGVAVLTYHGVIDAVADPRLERNFHTVEAFRGQVSLLRRLPVVPLSQVMERVARGGSARGAAAVAITFDDGYRNNLRAASILSEARLPWTLFVSTGPVDTGGAVWTAELSLLFLHGAAGAIEVMGRRYEMTSRANREAAFQNVRSELKALPAQARAAQMQAIRSQLPAGETERLLAAFPGFQSLAWPEIAQLAASGVEIGSHGVAHELHHDAQPQQVRREELSRSKQRIEQEIGARCRYFAYPNGTTNVRSSVECAHAGYELGFTVVPGVVRAGDDPHRLPRVSPGSKRDALLESLRARSGALEP